MRPRPLPASLLPAIVAACVLMAACRQGAAPTGTSTIVPAPLTENPSPAAPPAVAEPAGDASTSRPRISIDPALTILQIINVNLDGDAEEEQVIAVKRLSDVASHVSLIVADADPGQGSYYYQSWEADTLATDARVFSLAVKDVVGDQSLQIIASGMNEAGRLTLDVFHPVAPSTGKGLAYRPVFQLVADEVSIEESERPDSYSTEGKPGPSFPIQAFLRDTESQNVLDLVSIRYTWSPAEGRYVPGPSQKIPGENVQQAQLSALYLSSGVDAFERFIAGSWIQTDPSPGGAGSASYASILNFDPRLRTIALATGNTEDIYVWKESTRTIFKMLRVTGENVTVPLIRIIRRFTITADSPTSITVVIAGDDSVETTTVVYTKITDEARSRLLDRADARAGPATVTLEGRYTGTDGPTLEFGDSSFTWSDASGTKTGSYVVFSLGTATILTTRISAAGRAAPQTSSWLLTYRETRDPTRMTRTLGLSPVRLTVSGYEAVNGPDLLLTQAADVKKK